MNYPPRVPSSKVEDEEEILSIEDKEQNFFPTENRGNDFVVNQKNRSNDPANLVQWMSLINSRRQLLSDSQAKFLQIGTQNVPVL